MNYIVIEMKKKRVSRNEMNIQLQPWPSNKKKSKLIEKPTNERIPMHAAALSK